MVTETTGDHQLPSEEEEEVLGYAPESPPDPLSKLVADTVGETTHVVELHHHHQGQDEQQQQSFRDLTARSTSCPTSFTAASTDGVWLSTSPETRNPRTRSASLLVLLRSVGADTASCFWTEKVRIQKEEREDLTRAEEKKTRGRVCSTHETTASRSWIRVFCRRFKVGGVARRCKVFQGKIQPGKVHLHPHQGSDFFLRRTLEAHSEHSRRARRGEDS